jgi:3-hydroxyisobutyrate dehydrogenase-like beta-hydroxyacid dehydrogenase
MAQVAWIGLGKLGLPMAARLAAAGHQVLGYDRDPSRAGPAAAAGISFVPAPEAALAGASVLVTSLPDDAALHAALLDSGLVARAEPGIILVETSTVGAGASARLADAAGARGLAYLRAPVSGNPVLAERGDLTALVSGPREAFDAARPLIACWAKAQHYLGAGEEARYAKLAINLMVAVSAGMMAEALTLARKGGLDWGAMLDLLAESAVGSPLVKYKAPPLKARDFSSTFSCRQMAKDLDLILATARESGVPAPLAAQMREIYSALIAMGEGEADFIATVRHAERLAGLAEEDAVSRAR